MKIKFENLNYDMVLCSIQIESSSQIKLLLMQVIIVIILNFPVEKEEIALDME